MIIIIFKPLKARNIIIVELKIRKSYNRFLLYLFVNYLLLYCYAAAMRIKIPLIKCLIQEYLYTH